MREGERAREREALATETRTRQSGSRAEQVSVLPRGELALRLQGRRGETNGARSQQRSK